MSPDELARSDSSASETPSARTRALLVEDPGGAAIAGACALSPGTEVIRAGADGVIRGALREELLLFRRGYEPRPFWLGESEAARTAVLRPLDDVTVGVVDPSCNGLGLRALVRVVDSTWSEPVVSEYGGEWRCDEEGRAVCSGLWGLGSATFLVSLSDGSTGRVTPPEVPIAGGILELSVPSERVELSVMLVDERDEPLGGVPVTLTTDGVLLSEPERTDGSGRAEFVLRRAGAGPLSVEVQATLDDARRFLEKLFLHTDGPRQLLLTVRHEPVEVVVVDPVPGLSIASASADAAGNWRPGIEELVWEPVGSSGVQRITRGWRGPSSKVLLRDDATGIIIASDYLEAGVKLWGIERGTVRLTVVGNEGSTVPIEVLLAADGQWHRRGSWIPLGSGGGPLEVELPFGMHGFAWRWRDVIGFFEGRRFVTIERPSTEVELSLPCLQVKRVEFIGPAPPTARLDAGAGLAIATSPLQHYVDENGSFETLVACGREVGPLTFDSLRGLPTTHKMWFDAYERSTPAMIRSEDANSVTLRLRGGWIDVVNDLEWLTPKIRLQNEEGRAFDFEAGSFFVPVGTYEIVPPERFQFLPDEVAWEPGPIVVREDRRSSVHVPGLEVAVLDLRILGVMGATGSVRLKNTSGESSPLYHWALDHSGTAQLAVDVLPGLYLVELVEGNEDEAVPVDTRTVEAVPESRLEVELRLPGASSSSD